MALLSFIKDEDLRTHVSWVLSYVKQPTEKSFYKNAVDPFSAVFEASIQEIPLSKWVELERVRQGQKSMQNKLGDFHQRILGSIPGWEDLGTGHLIDIKNNEKKIIAEIKNKHNTTKGSDKVVIYDNLKYALDNEYPGFTAYYVEIIPKNRYTYDKDFSPSDNKTHTVRETFSRIHVTDGKSFYALASGVPDALKQLYEILPQVIGDVLGRPLETIVKDPFYKEIFKRTYP